MSCPKGDCTQIVNGVTFCDLLPFIIGFIVICFFTFMWWDCYGRDVYRNYLRKREQQKSLDNDSDSPSVSTTKFKFD